MLTEDWRPGLSSARPVQIRFFKLANLTSTELLGDPARAQGITVQRRARPKALISRTTCGTAEPVPFVHQHNSKTYAHLDSSRSTEPGLILFGRVLLRAIDTFHRQKVNCSANLDTLECTSPLSSHFWTISSLLIEESRSSACSRIPLRPGGRAVRPAAKLPSALAWIANSVSGKKRPNLGHQSCVILLQRRKVLTVESFVHP